MVPHTSLFCGSGAHCHSVAPRPTLLDTLAKTLLGITPNPALSHPSPESPAMGAQVHALAHPKRQLFLQTILGAASRKQAATDSACHVRGVHLAWVLRAGFKYVVLTLHP